MKQSPIPVKQKEKQMDFSEAIKQIIAGKKITKLEWKNENIYGILKDGRLMLSKEDNKFHPWIVNEGDLMGDDWITV